ncbi:RNA polymerase-binding protein DksA [human gut metagenome]|uniref:RNA polymerase-binding protein DksA n=1 Tax=human gut metagenome TaxID=408170 RepID=K1SCZ7_9ZZZZ
MANEKLRYSDQELEEFRAIIDEKLKVAKQTYHDCMAQLNHSDKLTRNAIGRETGARVRLPDAPLNRMDR